MRQILHRCCWALTLFLCIAGPSRGFAQENRFGFSTDLGALTGAPDGTHFAMSFGLDYYIDPAFSFGLMTLFTPASELNTYAFAGAAKYHIRFDEVTIVPFAGLGFIHMNLDQGGPNRIDDSSTSYWIPLGISAEFPVSSNIALSTTFMFSLHRIQINPIPRDENSLTILFGVHFGP